MEIIDSSQLDDGSSLVLCHASSVCPFVCFVYQGLQQPRMLAFHSLQLPPLANSFLNIFFFLSL